MTLQDESVSDRPAVNLLRQFDERRWRWAAWRPLPEAVVTHFQAEHQRAEQAPGLSLVQSTVDDGAAGVALAGAERIQSAPDGNAMWRVAGAFLPVFQLYELAVDTVVLQEVRANFARLWLAIGELCRSIEERAYRERVW